MDADLCYRLMLARDPRADGRFFTAVKTTGIFCRPVCPAARPKRANVAFYPTAAAAIGAGFRPCLRCHPEAAPGSPGWLGTEATVRRALRGIGEGALDGTSIDTFAAHLGVGARHLRRLFHKHVGAGPKTVARTRRVLFAKQLLDQTALSMTEVAFAAGFRSVRRFNAEVRSVYGNPPRSLRRARFGDHGNPGAMTLILRTRPPFPAAPLLAFLARRALPGVESVTDGSYRRTFRVGDCAGTVAVTPTADGVRLLAPASAARILVPLVARVRRLFDLDADPEPIDRHLSADLLLARSVRARPGLRVPGAWDPFELAVRAVLGQQVTVAGARTLAGRLVAALGEPLGAATPGLDRLFPTPAALCTGDLEGLGLTTARRRTLRELARAFEAGHLPGPPALLDETVDRLAALPGIGPWTAHYIALRGLGEPDAFCAGDLGLRKALAAGGALPTERQVAARAEGWRPWRGYAALHLWTAG